MLGLLSGCTAGVIGGHDSGHPDPTADSGTPSTDAGVLVTDAGQPTIDAGTSDAGARVDAGIPTEVMPPPLPCTKTVGTGSGQVDIQQAALSLVDDDVVCVRGGTYESINIANITASVGHRITIQNDGVVTFGGTSGGNALTRVTITGTGTGATPTANGFQFKNIAYRALQIDGTVHSLTLQYLDFENVADYTIYFGGDAQVFDGTDATALSELKVLHCRAKNFGGAFLQLTGGATGSTLTGIATGTEVAWNTLTDTPSSNYPVYLGNAFGVNVHHNVFSGLSLQLAQHNGMVFLNGDGQVHHNFFRNYLGEGIRLWPYSWGQVGRIDVFGNVFLESMKYSPVEVQAFTADVTRNAHTHFTNVRIFNNTAGNINLQTLLPNNYTMWVAGLVDTYDFEGGTVEITNNLVFNVQMQKDNNPIVNLEGGGVPTSSHNLYFATSAQAGLVDEVSVRLATGSAAIGAGVAVSGLGLDFYGAPYPSPPDVGAVAY